MVYGELGPDSVVELVVDVRVEPSNITDAVINEGTFSQDLGVLPMSLTHLATLILGFEMLRVQLCDNVGLVVFEFSFQVSDLFV